MSFFFSLRVTGEAGYQTNVELCRVMLLSDAGGVGQVFILRYEVGVVHFTVFCTFKPCDI